VIVKNFNAISEAASQNMLSCLSLYPILSIIKTPAHTAAVAALVSDTVPDNVFLFFSSLFFSFLLFSSLFFSSLLFSALLFTSLLLSFLLFSSLLSGCGKHCQPHTAAVESIEEPHTRIQRGGKG
jgi:hypothetical protein